MTDNDKAARLAQSLGPVRERFRLRCAADLAKLTGGAMAPDELHAVAHRLAGMGATLGFPSLSIAARIVDDRLTNGDVPAPDELDALQRAMSDAVGQTIT